MAFIVLCGPPVGIIIYVLTVMSLDRPSHDLGEILEVTLVALLMGWPIGMLPAGLAALVWRVLPLPHGLWPRIGLAALVGAVTAPIGMAMAMHLLEVAPMIPPVAALFALSGAGALVATAIPNSQRQAV